MLTNTLSLLQTDEFTDIQLSEYSQFKHGSKTIARSFGKALSKVVGPALLHQQDIVIYPAPYNNVPTASSALKDYLVSSLTPFFFEKEVQVKQSKIHRLYSYDDDYGQMTKEQRQQAISSDIFSIDKNFFKPSDTLVFIDDIKITGSHEERIKELLDREKIINDCIFVYLYEYTGQDASIEHRLNHRSVNNLRDVNDIIRNDEFIFNTRVIKYILKAELLDFSSFITYQSDNFLETLYNFSVLNDYHKNPKYSVNFGILHNLLKLKN